MSVRLRALLRAAVLIPAIAWSGLALLSAQAREPHPRAVSSPPQRVSVPQTGELQVNTSTVNHQRNPDVAARTNGDFVVVWEHEYPQAFEYNIIGRRFASSGTALSSEIPINTFTQGVQADPHVAVDGAGNFVVVWWSPQGGGLAKVFAQRFASTGAPQGSELQINVHTTTNNDQPDVAMDASGRFLVVWHSAVQDGAGSGVFARRFDGAGVAQSAEFQVNAYTLSDQRYPAVAVDGSGRFVVAWRSTGQDGAGTGIFARRFDSTGQPIATEFLVPTYVTGAQDSPAVGAAADGAFLIAWTSFQDGDGFGVFSRRFDSSGSPQSSDLQVNKYTQSSQTTPAVSAVGSDFVVTWASYQDGSSFGVFLRRFDSAGFAQDSGDLQVNTFTAGTQHYPAVAGDGVGGFVVAWDSFAQDGDDYGVFARRFVGAALLDIDADGEVEPLTDGLLVLRHLFGFTGAVLVAGAVDGDCTRCSAASITNYLFTLELSLDIDGDGEVEPLSDGLLVLRYLFGFTGATLTAGALDGQCSQQPPPPGMRCTSEAIVAYLQGLD